MYLRFDMDSVHMWFWLKKINCLKTFFNQSKNSFDNRKQIDSLSSHLNPLKGSDEVGAIFVQVSPLWHGALLHVNTVAIFIKPKYFCKIKNVISKNS